MSLIYIFLSWGKAEIQQSFLELEPIQVNEAMSKIVSLCRYEGWQDNVEIVEQNISDFVEES